LTWHTNILTSRLVAYELVEEIGADSDHFPLRIILDIITPTGIVAEWFKEVTTGNQSLIPMGEPSAWVNADLMLEC
jgi:hypothetical protein